MTQNNTITEFSQRRSLPCESSVFSSTSRVSTEKNNVNKMTFKKRSL